MSSSSDDSNGIDPFADPDLAELLRSGKVVRRPGMAAEMLKDLAPLLKADGIDLDDPDADFTQEEFSAALGRAQEQHNLGLFTAVGTHRGLALRVLKDFARFLPTGQTDVAEGIIASVPTEPGPSRAGTAQVIGTGLGLLDSWFADAELGPKVKAAAVPKWSKASRNAGRDILVLAGKNRAFDSLDALIINHTGFHVFEGTLLAVAGAVAMIARREGTEIDAVADRLLPTEEFDELFEDDESEAYGSTPMEKLAGTAFAPGASTDEREQLGEAADMYDELREMLEKEPLYQRFIAYLAEEYGPIRPYSGLHSSVVLLLSTAFAAELDIEKPSGAMKLIDEIERFAGGEPDPAESASILSSGFTILDEYVHYRMSIDSDPSQWDDVHELVERSGAQSDPLISVLLAEIAEPPEDTVEAAGALERLPLIRGANGLLTWIGKRRRVSPSGNLRRSDITEAAAFFGIRAVGVSHDPHGPIDEFRTVPIPEAEAGDSGDGAGPEDDADAAEVGRDDAGRADDGALFELGEGTTNRRADTHYVVSATDVPVLGPVWHALDTTALIVTNTSSVRPGPGVTGLMAGQRLGVEDMRDLIMVFIVELIESKARGVSDIFEDAVVTLAAYRLVEILAVDEAPDATDVDGATDAGGADEPPIGDGDAMSQIVGHIVENIIAQLIGTGILVREEGGRCSVPPEVRYSLASAILMALSVPEELINGPEGSF